jgi:hypothetical protein
MSLTTKIVIDIMKKLLLALMFLSPFSFADWGDVYYCQMTSFVGTDAEGTVTKYKLEKFQFKLDKSQQAAVYGNSGYFKGWRGKLADWATHRPEERWTTQMQYSITMFEEGKFFSSDVYYDSITTVSADCDKF